VTAEISGVGSPGRATTKLAVAVTPDGDAGRGAALSGASCAVCHGETGHGSAAAADGATYLLAGMSYDFPAPGLNAEMGNVAEDPDWNAALLAVSSRSDVDNGGVTLQAPMPDCMSAVDPATTKTPTTQDFADMYAFLKTQTR
jgi:mono/diheme cytochrome c family protein